MVNYTIEILEDLLEVLDFDEEHQARAESVLAEAKININELSNESISTIRFALELQIEFCKDDIASFKTKAIEDSSFYDYENNYWYSLKHLQERTQQLADCFKLLMEFPIK